MTAIKISLKEENIMKFKLNKKGYLGILLAIFVAAGFLVGTTSAVFGGGTTAENIIFDFPSGRAFSIIPGEPGKTFSAIFSGNVLTKPNGELQIKILNGTAYLDNDIRHIHFQGSKIRKKSTSTYDYYGMPVKIQLQGSGGEKLKGAGLLYWYNYPSGGGRSGLKVYVVGQTEGWLILAGDDNPPTIVPR